MDCSTRGSCCRDRRARAVLPQRASRVDWPGMTIALTLSLYVARVFSFFMMGMLGVLTLVFVLFDFIELLRRAAPRPDAGFMLVAEIAGLRMPWVAMQTLPFAVLLGGMFAFEKLTRSSELIVARAAGLSAGRNFATVCVCRFEHLSGLTLRIHSQLDRFSA